MKARAVAELGLLCALAIILGWVEHLVPVLPSVPGVKLGLGNIVVLIALCRFGWREAAAVSAAKVLLSALLFGSVSGLIYSASGAAASFLAMVAARHSRYLTPIGVSTLGGGAHICAQMGAAMLVTATPQLWRLLAPLLLCGTLTGVVNGLLAGLLLKKLPEIKR